MAEIREIRTDDIPPNTNHILQDLFRKWEMPDQFVAGVSQRWKCQVVPLARNEDEIRVHTLHGDPVLLSSDYAQKVFDQVGDDALDYLIEDPERNVFPRQKIAFVAGRRHLILKTDSSAMPSIDLSLTSCASLFFFLDH